MSKILIIDDEEQVREELSDRLSSMGHESEEASCQEEAERMIDEIDYDLVLLDLAIPVKFEGVARVEHGRNLLERIASKAGAPPVIVITANGLSGHKLAVEMMDIGAATFVGKPFDEDPIEPKIKKWLEKNPTSATDRNTKHLPFKGGVLTLHEDCIELCGQIVGGTRGNGYIRKIVQFLMLKKDGRYPKISGAQLAKAIGGNLEAPAVASAIMEFRNSCSEKVGCDKNEVIETVSGGGYRISEKIEAKFGRDEDPLVQIDDDKGFVIRKLRRFGKQTRKQLADAGNFPIARIRAALSSLDADGLLSQSGSGSGTVYEMKDLN